VVADPHLHDDWACYWDPEHPVKWDKLTEIDLNCIEIEGETAEHLDVVVMDDRKILEWNMPEDDPAISSRYSVILQRSCRTSTKNDIVNLVKSRIPEELHVKDNDTKTSFITRIKNVLWLDELFNNRKPKDQREVSINEDEESMQALRRTTSLCWRKGFVFRGAGEEGDGRHVTGLLCLPCREAPTSKLMCRPMRRPEHALMLSIWEDAWPFLTEFSRKCPTNHSQFLAYHEICGKFMGRHHDNYFSSGLKEMIDGRDPCMVTSRGGLENSQKHGTSVIIFTISGEPMTIEFSYPDFAKGGWGQSYKKYKTSPAFTCKCGPGHITVVDVIDDMLYCHEVSFMKVDSLGDKTGKKMRKRERFAIVYRWLTNRQHFFAETSTIRRTSAMMEAEAKNKTTPWPESKFPRNVLS
jgi:hypothetical protein